MRTIGAVGYLNALPLIHGLGEATAMNLRRQVPSSLLSTLETAKADVALCPVIDFQRSTHELTIVPSGAIGSRARTLTVRVFSRIPFKDIRQVAVDEDSHTSVALIQIVFSRLFNRVPKLVPLTGVGRLEHDREVQAALLIGDKVVTREPSRVTFPHQLDLGQAWRDLTGLPFVFATWMAREGSDLGTLPEILETTRRRNLKDLERFVPRWAQTHGWPTGLALTYLRDLLEFDIGPEQLQSMRLFWGECASLGLIASERPLRLYTKAAEPQPMESRITT